MNIKLYTSRAFLYRRYVVQGKTIIEIAEECGCSHMTIQRYLEKFELIKNPRAKKR